METCKPGLVRRREGVLATLVIYWAIYFGGGMRNINIGWTVPVVWEGWGNDNNYLFLGKYLF